MLPFIFPSLTCKFSFHHTLHVGSPGKGTVRIMTWEGGKYGRSTFSNLHKVCENSPKGALTKIKLRYEFKSL